MEKLWFRRKLFGWGWIPITWQGWLMIVLYVVGIVGVANGAKYYTQATDIIFGATLPIAVYTVFLIIICWAKGEKPRWQWGRRKE